jgi:hypothetical protein
MNLSTIKTNDYTVKSLGIQTKTVYDIEVDATHNFFGNDILVHNSVWSDQEARNLLKAATDTKKIRKMVWNKKSSIIVDPTDIDENDPDSELVPRFFNFTGKIIFISNLQISKLDPDGAMRTRSLIINISPTDDEMLDYMKDMLMDVQLEDGLTMTKSMREAVFDEVATSKNKNALSLRRLVRALNIAAAADGAMDWKRLVKLYA